uniref:CSON005287 protein n=1 Tax=Culicoides sonorensis TaxID=179676 RepID=A0A336LHG2_CULSO
MESSSLSSSHLNHNSSSNVENGQKQINENNNRFNSDKNQGLIQMVQQLSPSILQPQQQGTNNLTRIISNNNNNETFQSQHHPNHHQEPVAVQNSNNANFCFMCRQDFASRNDFVNHLKSHIIDASNADIIAKVILDATNGLCT